MAELRIKPHYQQVAERQVRLRQWTLYRRHQAMGLLMIAAAVLLFWLLRGHRDWLFTSGWWRL
jgi:hypothetical protein